MQARKDVTQQGSTARVANAVYLGELVKFRLAPPGSFFTTLKVSPLLKSLDSCFSTLNVLPP
jgi:hypothetical protein